MNKIFLIGRLTKDATLKTTEENQKSYTKFSLAVDRDRRKEDEADFFQVSLWGKTAENLVPYLNKGKLISIIGTLRNYNFEDENGNRKYYTEVIGEEVKFLEFRKAE